MSENNKNNEYIISPYDKLVVDIRNNLTTRLGDLMSKLLNSAQDNLLDMSEAADNNKDQARYFELMHQLRALKPSIASTFDKKVKGLLLPASEFEASQTQHKIEDEDDELSLVGQDEMEGIVLVKSIGERAGSKYREQLQHLEARLEHLALKTSTVFTKDALLPTHFCQAFNDALSDDFDKINKKILFSMFEIEVTSKLDALYDSINNRLVDADILPQIKLHTQKQQPSRARPGHLPSSAVNPEENQHNDYADGYAGHPGMGDSDMTAGGGMSGNSVGGFAMTADPGGSYHNARQRTLQSQSGGRRMGDHAEAGSATNASYVDRDANRGAAGNTGYQHYTAGMPANQVGRVLGNFIGGMPFTPGNADSSSAAHSNFFPETTTQDFGHQEIIHALSGIQNLPQFTQMEQARFDAEAIKQAVLAEIAKTSGGAVTKRINKIAEKTIDFIELIFDAIVDDEEISDAIKTLLLRLQIPVIKASMVDQEFFIYDDHPARVLLDTIADAGAGITEHSDVMYKKLDKVISSILNEYDITTETFQSALDELNTIIEEQEASARTIEQEEQQQLLRKHARATVLKTLRATTTGQSLPEAVHPLILKRWPTLMFNHYLKKGKENDEWVNLAFTLRHLVESVQPITSAEQLAKLVAEKEELLAQTEIHLNTLSKSKKDVQNTVAAYKETLQLHIDDANFSAEEVSIAEEVVSNAAPVVELPIFDTTEEKQDIPANVMPGMWFQLYMGEDKAARRCKLSVIITEDANLMFVNHKGELVTEKSFDEFNEEVANDTSKMIMGHSVFDHAFKSVVDRLN